MSYANLLLQHYPLYDDYPHDVDDRAVGCRCGEHPHEGWTLREWAAHVEELL